MLKNKVISNLEKQQELIGQPNTPMEFLQLLLPTESAFYHFPSHTLFIKYLLTLSYPLL